MASIKIAPRARASEGVDAWAIPAKGQAYPLLAATDFSACGVAEGAQSYGTGWAR